MELKQVLQERRTVRKFSQTPIPDEDLRDLLDAGRLASCARNDQRLRYVVVRTPELVDKVFQFTAWAGSVAPRRNPVPGETAPVAFIAVTGKKEDADSPLLQTDCGAAIQTIQLAAWEKGIGCCWMGAIDRQKIHELLGLSQESAILYIIALGFAAEKPVHDDISDPAQVKYYLDDKDLLHVPKLTVDAVSSWK